MRTLVIVLLAGCGDPAQECADKINMFASTKSIVSVEPRASNLSCRTNLVFRVSTRDGKQSAYSCCDGQVSPLLEIP